MPLQRNAGRLGIALAVLAAAGCGQSGMAEPASTGPDANALLQKAVAGIAARDDVVSATIAAPPDGMSMPAGEVWVEVRLEHASEADPDWTLALWEADLIAAGYDDLARAAGEPRLGGLTVARQAGSGRTQFVSAERYVADESVGSPTAAEGEIRRQLAKALAARGLKPLSIGFERPEGLAPLVVASASDGTTFAAAHPNVEAELLPRSLRTTLNGLYVEVVDASSGAPVEAAGYTVRSQSTLSWRPAGSPFRGFGVIPTG